ncbi:MAG TPA: hypothetical protein VKZ41_03735 [Gemmatimonadales bacterium]|nr:hypothetical protein [Gemmatimonadales bacterium]
MDWFALWFVRASLVWLAAAVTLGSYMAAHPPAVIYRTAHLHMALLGFVTMMIYGVAYHILPRFMGKPLRNRKLAGVHWWLSNLGLLMLSTGFIWRSHAGPRAVPLLSAGGILSALGAYLFVGLMLRLLWKRTVKTVPVSRPGQS